MKYVGIDIASEKHFVAVVNERSEVEQKSVAFAENAEGYQKLFDLLGPPEEVAVVAMEATGHYWRNVFSDLASKGYRLALINPLRTSRFASEDMQRTKTDAIDAVRIATFAAQKRLQGTQLPDEVTVNLRELTRLRTRLVQDFTDRVRQLHRVVDLSFPELTQHLTDLSSSRTTAILAKYPTAEAFRSARPRAIANLQYAGQRRVGMELAQALVAAAKVSVGAHQGAPYRVQVEYFCQDLDVLRERLKSLEKDIDDAVEKHQVAKLLTTIDGLGPTTAARIIAAVGNPGEFRDGKALASYVGAVPGLRQSGARPGLHAPLSPYGNAELRRALYMPTLVAVQHNPLLKAFYGRLVAAGKPPKLALLAAMNKLLHVIHSVAKNLRPFSYPLPTATP